MEAFMDAQRETNSLIAAEKVSGTSVYNRDRENIGEIYDVMLDKVTGKVAYAIMSFGGFLGIGEKYHPLPWSMLKYDTGVGGYVVDVSKDVLQGAPAYAEGADPWGSRAYEEKVYGYYGVPPYWTGMF
jgi:sporulation protein YlmC with PRC-barrel domain